MLPVELPQAERRFLGCTGLCLEHLEKERGSNVDLGRWVSMWPWVKTNEIPFWARRTTQFSRDFSGDWDVHWGYEILTHGHVGFPEGHKF